MPSNPSIKDRTWKRILPRLRRLEVETSVRPGLVVVGGVGPEDLLQVAAAEHEHPVQALGPDRANPSLGERVRSRACGKETRSRSQSGQGGPICDNAAP